MQRLKVLFLALFLLASVQSSAFAVEFVVTEQELMQLETNLIQLKTLNNELQTELANLKQLTETQEQLLMSANKLLNEYAKDQRAKLRQLKLQRGLLIGGLLAALIIR